MAEKMSLGAAFDQVMLDPADISKLLQSLALANTESSEMNIALHEAAANIVAPPPEPPPTRSASGTDKQSKD